METEEAADEQLDAEAKKGTGEQFDGEETFGGPVESSNGELDDKNAEKSEETVDSGTGESPARGFVMMRNRAVEWLRVGNRSLSIIVSTTAILMLALATCVSMNISQGEQLNAANVKLKELSEKNAGLVKHNETLKDGNRRLRERIAELDKYQDQQATIDDTAKKLEEMHASYDKLLEERDALQGQLDAKRLAEEQAARERSEAVQNQQSSGGYGGTVYWVSGGSVYHLTPNCAALKRSNGIMSGPKSSCPRTRCCSLCG